MEDHRDDEWRQARRCRSAGGGTNKPAGEKPLAYLLRVMRDENAAPERRDRAAIAAAQFCHPIVGAKREAKPA